MDLKDAFHHIPLDEKSRPTTGTSTPIGLQQWRVVVMGWKNSVSEITAGYVDDIIAVSDEVLGETTPDLLRKHDAEIRMVLVALKQGNMVADIRKCIFCQGIHFLWTCPDKGHHETRSRKNIGV